MDRVLGPPSSAGGKPGNGGGYITVWAPRQRGKSWIVGEAVRRAAGRRAASGHGPSSPPCVERLKTVRDVGVVIRRIAADIAGALGVDAGPIRSADEFDNGLQGRTGVEGRSSWCSDEFDALPAEAIEGIVGVFRNIHGPSAVAGGPAGRGDGLTGCTAWP